MQRPWTASSLSRDSQFVKMPMAWSYAHPSGYSWHLLLKLFNNKAAFYKKLINGILFQSYVIWNSFQTLNFVWHFENSIPKSILCIKNFFQT